MVETVIYAYLAICLSMIGFNIAYIFYQKWEGRIINWYAEKYRLRIREQLAAARSEGVLTDRDVKRWKKELLKQLSLYGFEKAADLLAEEDLSSGRLFFEAFTPVWTELEAEVAGRSDAQKAYFAYLIAKITQRFGISAAGRLSERMMEYLKSDSMYCRENALNLLEYSRDAQKMVRAVQILNDREEVFFHEKILTEDLLNFQGDHHQLISLLWEALASWKLQVQLAVLNYIRMREGGYEEQFWRILDDEQANAELRYAALREEPANWEYAAVSAWSLASYPGPQTVGVLKKAVTSRNWHVRRNAAMSLKRLDVKESDLQDILEGGDQYAREMLQYILRPEIQKGSKQDD